MVANVGVAVGIASPVLVQQLFPLPVSWLTINHLLIFWSRPMSGNVGSATSKSSVVENVGVAIESASPSLSVQELLLRLVSTCHFSVSKQPYWHFRLIDTRGNDVFLCSVHLATRHFKPHLLSGACQELWHVKWYRGAFTPPLPNSCSRSPLPQVG